MNLYLPRYREVKDRYCVGYFGPCNDYITLLLGLRKQLEDALPGVQLYIGCRSELCGPERTISESSIIEMIRNPWTTQFGHIRELRCDLKSHPIQQFLAESQICIKPAQHISEPENRTVRIYPDGISPTKSMDKNKVQALTQQYEKLGYLVRQDGPWNDAGIVLGVESTPLWEAAFAGKSTILFNSGLGKALFSVICPWGKVIS